MSTLILVLLLTFGLFMAFASAYAERNSERIDHWIKKLNESADKHKTRARELSSHGADIDSK